MNSNNKNRDIFLYWAIQCLEYAKNKIGKRTTRSKGCTRELYQGKERSKKEYSNARSTEYFERIRERIRTRKRSIFQSKRCKTDTKEPRLEEQIVTETRQVTNPFFIFYQKLKTTWQIILLLDAMDSHPSFAIPMLKMLYHTWKDAKVIKQE